jgi:hypothetical protein
MRLVRAIRFARQSPVCVCVRHAVTKSVCKATTRAHAHISQTSDSHVVVTGAKNKTGALSAFTPATPQWQAFAVAQPDNHVANVMAIFLRRHLRISH